MVRAEGENCSETGGSGVREALARTATYRGY